MRVKIYPFARALASYVLPSSIFYRPGSGGTFSSEYCYSVWLRHLHYLIENKLFSSLEEIKNIAEIGPGDSLGIGLSAIYSGASNYYAFDVLEHAKTEKNEIINSELKEYFIAQKEIPNTEKQRFTAPSLPSYSFPEVLKQYSREYYELKYNEIRKALMNGNSDEVNIQYIVPWMNSDKKDLKNIDLIFSQAVMEHVDDIEFAYREMFKWLRPGGVISHQVDFKTHEMTSEWNGHWFIGDAMWELLSHGRKYPMNRLPLSSHIQMIEKAGFQIVFIKPVEKENNFKGQLPKVPNIVFTESDLVTSSALIQAIKK
jgi:SAM-dependent methyltransferase